MTTPNGKRPLELRLLQLAAYGGPYSGGFIPLIRELARAARQRGWPVETVFHPVVKGRSWLADLERDKIPVRFAPEGGRRELGSWLSVVLAESELPTLIHTHFTRYDVPAVLAARHRPRTVVIWDIRTALAPGPGALLRNALKFMLLGRSVQRILCPATDLARDLVRRGAPRGRVEVVPNAIDVTRFPLQTAADRAAARRTLELSPDAVILLHFGWDWEVKGGELFLRTVKRLLEREIGSVVALSSQGGLQARELAAELGIERAVRVLGPAERVQSLYAAADVFVSTSRAEGGMPPFAVAEALSSGTPVVATRLPGHEVVAREVKAYRLAARDPDELTHAIELTLSRPPNVAEAEATTAHVWIAENMALAALVESVIGIYETVAGGCALAK